MSEANATVAVPEVLVEVVEQLAGVYERAMALPDARKLEWEVHERLKEIDRRTMEICFEGKAREAVDSRIAEARCLSCDQWASLHEFEAPRYAITVRGRVDYRRPVFRCVDRGCQRERSLFDEQLGLEPKEHFTPLVQSKVAWAATSSASFERAVKDLSRLAELERRSKAAGDEARRDRLRVRT